MSSKPEDVEKRENSESKAEMIAKGAMAEHEKMGGRIITFYIRYIAYDQSVFLMGFFMQERQDNQLQQELQELMQKKRMNRKKMLPVIL